MPLVVEEVSIKRIDKSLPLPKYETNGSAGFDLICRETVTVLPQHIALIPANIIVKIPLGFMLLLTMRSSTPRKKGLVIAQGVGIIDNDYCGEEDELQIQVFNFMDHVVKVEKGERIAQAIFVPVITPSWNEVEQMSDISRGGFGSTG